MSTEDDRSDEPAKKVGYGRPPKEHQFPPGRSGNPKGRPKQAKGFNAEARAVLATPIKTRDGKRVSCRKAALMKLASKAIEGDMRGLRELNALAMRIDAEDEARAATHNAEAVNEEDAALIEAALRRLKREQS